MLHKLFTKFDNLCEKYNLYKVETIGDCYMVASGLISTQTNHARTIVAFSDELLRAASTVQMPTGVPVVVRVGIHSGVQPLYTTKCSAWTWAAVAVQMCPQDSHCVGWASPPATCLLCVSHCIYAGGGGDHSCADADRVCP